MPPSGKVSVHGELWVRKISPLATSTHRFESVGSCTNAPRISVSSEAYISADLSVEALEKLEANPP